MEFGLFHPYNAHIPIGTSKLTSRCQGPKIPHLVFVVQDLTSSLFVMSQPPQMCPAFVHLSCTATIASFYLLPWLRCPLDA